MFIEQIKFNDTYKYVAVSTWIAHFTIKNEWYIFTKQELRDFIRIRHGWKIAHQIIVYAEATLSYNMHQSANEVAL